MSITQLVLSLSRNDNHPFMFEEVVLRHLAFLYDLASACYDRRQLAEALVVCETILQQDPGYKAALLMKVRLLSEQGRVEDSLGLLRSMRQQGVCGDDVATETNAQLFAAADAHSRYLAAGEIERAVDLCEQLVGLCPDVLLFRTTLVNTLGLARAHQLTLSSQLDRRHYDALNETADRCQLNTEFDEELRYRVEIARHPLDQLQHSAVRVRNVVFALSRLLRIDATTFATERIGLAHELLRLMAEMPVTMPQDRSEVAAWERTMRMLLASFDLDWVFGPLPEKIEPLPLSIFSSSATPLTLSEVRRRCNETGARLVFSTSTSAEYFVRFGRSYISSISRACDCDYIVIICLCVSNERAIELIRNLDIDDEKLIFLCDEMFTEAEGCQIFNLGEYDPHPGPACYYNVSAMLHVDHILKHLERPVCITGIDTVLQRGVVDLLERFSDADVVLNQMGPQVLLGSQVVFNLVLLNPTANALIFVEFLRFSLLRNLLGVQQPEFLDQVLLHMAKHHLIANGEAAAVRFFEERDINNNMFNKDNFQYHLEELQSYRFLNIFAAGCSENALTADEI